MDAQLGVLFNTFRDNGAYSSKRFEMPVFTGFHRLHSDHSGILTFVTVFLSLERCRYDDTGAEGSVTVPESLGNCGRTWAGVTESGTVPQSLGQYFTAITPLQRLECCRRVFGTVLGLKILKNFGSV